MEPTINIQKVKFEFNMGKEKRAFDLYSRWQAFFTNQFARVVEKVLSLYDNQSGCLFIEKLEVDLGEIPAEDFYTSFPVLLEQKLHELMKQYRLPEDAVEIKKVSENYLLFGAFTHYLIHGFYPWPGNNYKGDFRSLFLKMIAEFSSEFREFLIVYGYYSPLRQRIVLQLNDSDLKELVKIINKTESDFISSYFDLLVSHENMKRVSAGKEKEHRHACWEVILSYLLVAKSGYFNRREFVDYTIAELAAHYNMDYNSLVAFLSGVVDEYMRDTDYRSELKTILTDLLNNKVSESANNPSAYDDDIEQLKYLLSSKKIKDGFSIRNMVRHFASQSFRDKLITVFSYSELATILESMKKLFPSDDFISFIEPAFSALIESGIQKTIDSQIEILKKIKVDEIVPVLFTDEIRRLLRSPGSRRKMISKMNEPQIYRLVKLLVPEETEFIISYSKTLDQQKERNAFEGKAGGEFQQLKWEFIFAVLIEETDMTFNRRSFVLSVISMLAAHYNLKTADLLSYIYQSIIENKISANPALITLLKELYFESREEKPRVQSVSLFNKATQENYYYSLLKEFITTGSVTARGFSGKLFEILIYLENYRPDLLSMLVEELKPGFILTDFISIVNHKELYRRLIMFVVQTYQISLPGGTKVKNLLGNIDEDRYRGVSVKVFKTLLLALLKNDIALYEKAWDSLTRETAVVLTGEKMLDTLPDDIVLEVISKSVQKETAVFLSGSRGVLLERIFSRKEMLRGVAECYRMDSRVAIAFDEIYSGIAPASLFRLLYRLFPSEGEDIKLLFKFLSKVSFSGKPGIYGHIIFEIILALLENRGGVFSKTVRFIISLGTDESEKQGIVASLQELSGAFMTDSALKDQVKSVLDDLEKQERVEKDVLPAAPEGETDFISWLIARFGKTDDFVWSGIPSVPVVSGGVAFQKFSELLTEQPELVQHQISQGILSVHKITHWVKKASPSLQLRWVQVMAPPYQKAIVEEAFLLIEWMKLASDKIPGITFPWQKLINLLVDFSSGQLLHIGRAELYKRLLLILFEGMNEKTLLTVIDEIGLKASNHGQLLGKTISAITKHIKNKPDTTFEINEVEKKLEDYVIDENEKEDRMEEIYIKNAGLVLCSPFLPRLFSLLGLLTEGEFTNRKSTERAVLLLQFMLYHDMFFPEYEMVLNKLLCGMETGVPIDREIEISDNEKDIMEKMLAGMISNWGKLGNTSVQGLIESFLKRDGKLVQKEEAWHLSVETRGFDVLLDTIPWSYTPIKHRWMKKPLLVKWR